MATRKESQRAFDTILNGMRKQGRASHVEGLCLYRNENGDKCAAGHLMTDEEVNRFGNWGRISSDKFIPFFWDNGWINRALMSSCQQAHDDSIVHRLSGGEVTFVDDEQFMERFEERMSSIATLRGLDYKGPDETKQGEAVVA